jgi:hypothetical protein
MKPAGKTKGSAKPSAKGVAGHALGLLILKLADNQAEAEVKQAETRKDTVLRLEKFTREDHLEFRKELADRMDAYRMAAEAIGLTISAYRGNDPKVNSVSVTVSLWLKMSSAIEAGFKPDHTQAWAIISLKATETLQSKAHTGSVENPSAVSPTKKVGRKATSGIDKAKALIETLPMQDKEKLALWLTALIESK